jgi:YebC/PmpR family DNA-binding regulatory protein
MIPSRQQAAPLSRRQVFSTGPSFEGAFFRGSAERSAHARAPNVGELFLYAIPRAPSAAGTESRRQDGRTRTEAFEPGPVPAIRTFFWREVSMSGHNKWSSIKHKKGIADAKRGAAFTKIIREINIAARTGGGDPESNARLRTAIEKAKAVNMPKDNVEKAIKKGTGELEGVNYEELSYEGYGPAGVAVYIEALTDNKNRTSADVRSLLTKHGGNLGANGCVSWMFEKKGLIIVDAKSVTEDALMELVLNAGADDMQNNTEEFEITTAPETFLTVLDALKKANVVHKYAQICMIPKNTVKLDEKKAEQVDKLVDVLEENDDIQNVYVNYERV